MKWLFVLLLLANVIYFGWELDRQTRIDVNNAVVPLVVPPDVKKLVLLQEMEFPLTQKTSQTEGEEKSTDDTDTENVTEQMATEKHLPSDSNRAATDVMIEKEFSGGLVSKLPEISTPDISQKNEPEKTLCFSYGPFPGIEQSTDVKGWFEQRNIQVKQRMDKEQAHQLFWIYLAPLKSRESAVAAIEDLKKKGIRDFRLINTGDLRNAISLGLFSTQAAVNRRLNELKNKGYQAIIIPYRDAKVIYWIDVKLVNQQNVLNDMLTDVPSRFNSVPVNCSEIALL